MSKDKLSTLISPFEGFNRPLNNEIKVVLPEPEKPVIPTNSPFFTEKLIFFKAIFFRIWIFKKTFKNNFLTEVKFTFLISYIR